MGIVERDGAALSPRPMTPTVEPLRLDFCSDIVNRGRGVAERRISQRERRELAEKKST
jgi:hypothetical protein